MISLKISGFRIMVKNDADGGMVSIPADVCGGQLCH